MKFDNDYLMGAHPKIIDQLVKTNFEAQSGYGFDDYTIKAQYLIKKACNCDTAQVTLLTGGTQTNALVIGSLLQLSQGVISADTGHINTHEAGAIEYTGHKVLPIKNQFGKISPKDLSEYLINFYKDETHAHMVEPGMVYISHPTEYGTLYSHDELTEISHICQDYKIPLFLDGARLGYALMSSDTDVTLSDICKLCDVFYIGGTKVGALCGEAVVFTKNNQPRNFMTLIKQRGALLAKGRLLGVQFATLFEDNLYFDISKHAIEMANKLKTGLQQLGYDTYIDSPTNQQFIIVNNSSLVKLKQDITFAIWEPFDANRSVIRLATSWATTLEDVISLLKIFSNL